MKLKYSSKFYLEGRKDKSGNPITENVPINFAFTYEGKRLIYYSGYRIDANKWNKEAQRVKTNCCNKEGFNSTIINTELDNLKKTATDIYTESVVLKQGLTIEALREELKRRINKTEHTENVTDILDKFIESESNVNTWTDSTVKKFSTLKNHLLQYQKDNRTTLTFEQMNETLLSKLIKYNRDKLSHRNTTIAKNLKLLKWFLNWATKNGYNKNLEYQSFNPKMKGVDKSGIKKNIIALDWEELMSIYNLEIKQNYLSQVRDVFCFCCFTGLRYSDVYNLKRSNIKGEVIEFTTIKTDDKLIIDLNDYSRAILAKYADIQFNNDKCLPVISNQKTNEYLKELGKMAELNDTETEVYFKGAERIENTFQKWELLTTHVGRKTFVTNALMMSIPAEIVMAWTGHKDHKMLDVYTKVVDRTRKEQMKKFNSKPVTNE